MAKKGFTIIELLIVMAIIAILVGIAIPKFKGIQDEAGIAKAKGEMRTLRSAVESYRIHQGSYPISLAYLPGAIPRITGTTLPRDPFNLTAPYYYQYARSPLLAYYVIWSRGPDGQSNITGIGDDGVITAGAGGTGDDIFTSNGSVEWGG